MIDVKELVDKLIGNIGQDGPVSDEQFSALCDAIHLAEHLIAKIDDVSQKCTNPRFAERARAFTGSLKAIPDDIKKLAAEYYSQDNVATAYPIFFQLRRPVRIYRVEDKGALRLL